jgi:hypothetical protein
MYFEQRIRLANSVHERRRRIENAFVVVLSCASFHFENRAATDCLEDEIDLT